MNANYGTEPSKCPYDQDPYWDEYDKDEDPEIEEEARSESLIKLCVGCRNILRHWLYKCRSCGGKEFAYGIRQTIGKTFGKNRKIRVGQ